MANHLFSSRVDDFHLGVRMLYPFAADVERCVESHDHGEPPIRVVIDFWIVIESVLGSTLGGVAGFSILIIDMI
ncbi:hypothetical protein D3C84_1192590 [compost metagenome]